MSRLVSALNTIIGYQKRLFLGVITALIMLPLHAWSSEATLQAAFVYNFIKFIDWPATEVSASLRLCVLGANSEMHEALDQLNGKTANKKVIEIVYFSRAMPVATTIESCQMVYQANRSTVILPQTLPKGVVLVANEPDQKDLNVSIALLRNTEGRIEFSINQSAVSSSGVKMSSQLLKLATSTRGGKG